MSKLLVKPAAWSLYFEDREVYRISHESRFLIGEQEITNLFELTFFSKYSYTGFCYFDSFEEAEAAANKHWQLVHTHETQGSRYIPVLLGGREETYV